MPNSNMSQYTRMRVTIGVGLRNENNSCMVPDRKKIQQILQPQQLHMDREQCKARTGKAGL